MKKSELYRMAQMCVLRDIHLDNDEKLNVIQLLADHEQSAVYMEKYNEEKAEGEQNADNSK